MEKDLSIMQGLIIPMHELEITASRAGGPGGQHVNKASTRITIRWNIRNTTALTPEQKERILEKLSSQLTSEGDLVIHSSTSRSQQQNKDMALSRLVQQVRKALHVPKKRIATAVSKIKKETRLQEKSKRGLVKKLRGKIQEE